MRDIDKQCNPYIPYSLSHDLELGNGIGGIIIWNDWTREENEDQIYLSREECSKIAKMMILRWKEFNDKFGIRGVIE